MLGRKNKDSIFLKICQIKECTPNVKILKEKPKEVNQCTKITTENIFKCTC